MAQLTWKKTETGYKTECGRFEAMRDGSGKFKLYENGGVVPEHYGVTLKLCKDTAQKLADTPAASFPPIPRRAFADDEFGQAAYEMQPEVRRSEEPVAAQIEEVDAVTGVETVELLDGKAAQIEPVPTADPGILWEPAVGKTWEQIPHYQLPQLLNAPSRKLVSAAARYLRRLPQPARTRLLAV